MTEVTDTMVDAAYAAFVSRNTRVGNLSTIRAAIEAALAAREPDEIEAAAREFLAATEALCDWMNGNDLSADHSSQKPEDYNRLCNAMNRLQDALGDAETEDER